MWFAADLRTKEKAISLWDWPFSSLLNTRLKIYYIANIFVFSTVILPSSVPLLGATVIMMAVTSDPLSIFCSLTM